MTETPTLIDFLNDTNEEELIDIASIDALIDEHRKHIIYCRKEIKKCNNRIENLEFKKKKFKYGENTVFFEIADQLHNKCTLLHNVDNSLPSGYKLHCDYNNGNWDNYTTKSVDRIEYYNKAHSVVETARRLNISIRKAMQILDAV